MKVKNLFFVGIMFVASHALVARPLTIINSTFNTIIFNVMLSDGGAKRIAINASNKWSHELGHESFVSLNWSVYSEELEKNCNYAVNVNQVMPKITHGGSVAISHDGNFIYDQ